MQLSDDDIDYHDESGDKYVDESVDVEPGDDEAGDKYEDEPGDGDMI